MSPAVERHTMACHTLLLAAGAVLVVVSGTAAAAGNSNAVMPDRYCLSCLCVASSDCDLSTPCREVGGRSFCGPFYMTEHFWRASNVSTEQRFSQLDYLGCAQDVDCAGQAVTLYMASHATDCDDDGHITCKDFGLTHLLGPRRCHDPAQRRAAEETVFVRRFARCLLDTLGLLGAGRRVRPHCQPRLLTWRAAADFDSEQQQLL
ncbi:hypothetical protein FJT64_024841 [Amphibalanus amphitrite]|uniref:lysozyme n=1 Tax=Amphibalanus amphitrite TaxID=1232801 RepID=A0A6A4W6Z0_AMPAM|nr:hypothetical protein FJT64_024841 [Amphibalanus amphitrite]